eukprot:gene2161-biopygen1589
MVGVVLETRVVDPAHLRVLPQVARDGQRALADAVHAQRQRFDALQDQEGVERREGRPGVAQRHDAGAADLTHLLRSKAVLMPGATVSLTIEKTGELQTWQYQGGLRDYLMQTLHADPLIPLFEGEHHADGSESENFAQGEGATWCVAFTEDGAPVRESYVNLIPTVDGGDQVDVALAKEC